MRNYMRGHWIQNKFELGRDVLAEIPTQFMQFMNSREFKPSTPEKVSTGAFPQPTSEPSTPLSETSTSTSLPPPYTSIYPPPPATAPSGTYPHA
jgi:hypothetical protein